MDGSGDAQIDPVVLVLGVSLALSLLGMPRLTRPKGRTHRESFGTRWAWFDWHHPFLARTLASTLVVIVALVLARAAWIWGPALWRHDIPAALHGVMGSVSGH